MAVSKVILNGTTLIDTTQKTVTSASMLNGATALKNDGTDITGSIATKTSTDMTVSGATVTAPAGYYASNQSKSVASGTAGTPTATKGTVSNHSVTVTPSVTNTTGYITGSTKTGTAVTVSASELDSGTKSISANGTGIDVVGYAAVDVALPSGTEGTPVATKGTVSNHSITVTPSVTNTAGVITGGTHTGTAATVSASELDSGTKSILANGTNIDVVGYAAVDVEVPSTTVEALSVTQNGTYTASSGHAYSPVTVNVSGGGSPPAGTNITAYISVPATGTWTVSVSNGTANGFDDQGEAVVVTDGTISSVTVVSSATRQYLKNTMRDYQNTMDTVIKQYAFYYRTGLETVESKATSIEQYAFGNCSNLRKLDLTSTSSINIAANVFSNCYLFEELLVRSNSVSTLASSALSGTRIPYGEGGIYVPRTLVDSYKAATNWSVCASNIYPIEDYPVTNYETISDDWATIIANEANGTYSTKYSVGDRKIVSYDGTDVYAVLVAIDGDTLSTGSGTAKLTWILNPILEVKRMNATNVTTGGWPASELRSYIRESCLPKLPEIIRTNIKEVSKTYYDYGSSSTLTNAETVWIPSSREMYSGGSGVGYETSGVSYTDVFGTNQTDIRKIKFRLDTGSASGWWLRSACSSTGFRGVSTSGGAGGNGVASSTYGLVLGFCT